MNNDYMIPLRIRSNAFYVYVLKVNSDDSYKIGHTTHLKKRLSTINTATPDHIMLVEYFRFSSLNVAKKFERHLHSTFAAHRIRARKEWFRFGSLNFMELIRIEYDGYEERLTAITPIPERLKRVMEYSLMSPETKVRLFNNRPQPAVIPEPEPIKQVVQGLVVRPTLLQQVMNFNKFRFNR